MPKIKIDKADRAFSLYIRERADWKCERCGNESESLQCSHYFSRGKESTRFDPNNANALCYGCHQYFGSADKEGYRQFKIKELGEAGFKRLILQWNTYQKKDRKLSYLVWKKEYQNLCIKKHTIPRKI